MPESPPRGPTWRFAHPFERWTPLIAVVWAACQGAANVNGGTVSPDAVWVFENNRARFAAFSYAQRGDGPPTTSFGGQTGLSTAIAVFFDEARDELLALDESTAFTTGGVRAFVHDASGNVAPARSSTGINVKAAAYDADAGLLVGVISNTIVVFDARAAGPQTPLRTIAGAQTGLDAPRAIALDAAHGEVVVANASSVTFYRFGDIVTPGAPVDVPPIRTISGIDTELANGTSAITVDAMNGEIVVASDGDQPLRVFDRLASGNAAPLRRIAYVFLYSSKALLADPEHGEIWAASGWGAFAFSRLANGNVEPVRSIRGGICVSPPCVSPLDSPSALALDRQRGELFVADRQYQRGILVYSRTAAGDVAPVREVSGRSLRFEGLPLGMDCSAARRELFVMTGLDTSGNAGGVAAFPTSSTGAATPSRTLRPRRADGFRGSPMAIAVDGASGNLVVAIDNDIVTYPLDAEGDALPLSAFRSGLSSPIGALTVIGDEIAAFSVDAIEITKRSGRPVRTVYLPPSPFTGLRTMAYDAVADALAVQYYDAAGSSVRFFKRSDGSLVRTLSSPGWPSYSSLALIVNPMSGEVLVGAISKLLLFSPDAGIGAAPTREIGGGETQLQEVMMLSFCH